MCKPANEENRVLAAETFFRSNRPSRENSQSVIKFDTPVNISEIKILSPSVYLSTANGGLILGATEPSEFSIQFLCNNVNRPHTTSYVSLGSLDYEEDRCTRFTCHNNIWSDKLVVCGQFSTITVVVYGSPKNTDADNVQKSDRTCNLPLLEEPTGVSEIMPLAPDFLELDPEIVTDRMDSDRSERSDSVFSDRSDSNLSDRSSSDTMTDRSGSDIITDRSELNFTNGFSPLQFNSNYY